MKKEESNQKSKAGRKPLADPAIHRHDFRLNGADSIRLENMFNLSGYKYRAHFIKDKVLNGKLKIEETNKSLGDYVILLSLFRAQFRRIGNNYNQVLRLLKEQFEEKKALAYLYKLEKATIEMAINQRKIEEQIQKMEQIWLQK